MFVGHALLAFALVATVARWRGVERYRALQVGLLAGLFATAPDLDILYGPVGLLGGVSGVSGAADAFWSTGNVVHRGPTHSVVVGLFAAVAFACWRRATAASRSLALVVLAGIVGVVATVSGLLGATVTAAFLTGGLAVTTLAGRWDVTPSMVGLTAFTGLLTHPFGDLFTGTPPHLLYPLDVSVVGERIALHPDPTLNLLGAFGVELAIIWAALVVAFSLTERPVRTHVDRRAVLGIAYAGAAVMLPAPTLDASYQFVFSVLAVGVVAFPRRQVRRVDVPRVVCTALAVVTYAALAYGVAYVLL